MKTTFNEIRLTIFKVNCSQTNFNLSEMNLKIRNINLLDRVNISLKFNVEVTSSGAGVKKLLELLENYNWFLYGIIVLLSTLAIKGFSDKCPPSSAIYLIEIKIE